MNSKNIYPYKFFPWENEFLDKKAMRFAHFAGSLINLFCLIFLYTGYVKAGWILTSMFAVLKTISAAGFCPATKLYGCATDDSCCTFIKKKSC